ncbi:MAG: hypothetical protein JWO95_2536 [Verrucomicrobiales bacterium]|nr:hypothetical protein [Verrucomicrobiales bacterium]
MKTIVHTAKRKTVTDEKAGPCPTTVRSVVNFSSIPCSSSHSPLPQTFGSYRSFPQVTAGYRKVWANGHPPSKATIFEPNASGRAGCVYLTYAFFRDNSKRATRNHAACASGVWFICPRSKFRRSPIGNSPTLCLSLFEAVSTSFRAGTATFHRVIVKMKNKGLHRTSLPLSFSRSLITSTHL